MTVTDQHSIFDLICDKRGSDYFTPEEKDSFLNLGMNSVANDYFYNIKKKAAIDGVPPYGFEMSQLVSEVFWPLIHIVDINTNNSGEVTKTQINTLLGGSKKMMHLIAVSVIDDPCEDSDGYTYCRFVRHNDFYKIYKNVFKKPVASHPVFRYINNAIKISPSGVIPARISVIREPAIISLSTLTDCELPDFLHNEVMFRSLSFAGLSIRERELYTVSEQFKSQNG